MECVEGHKTWAFFVFVFSMMFAGIQGASSSESSDGFAGLDLGLVVGGVACVLVLIVVVAICADRKVHTELMDRGPPYWARCLQFKQEYNNGLTSVSDGLNNLSPFHVTRERLGQAVTDGARWDTGFTDGKHVFEVVWPAIKNRGINSTIGVATLDVPIKKPGRVSLVGHHSQSWGFDLSARKMVHSNQRTGSFSKQFPDRFYVYLDMDGGKIGFGEDVKALGNQALFYGNLVNNIRLDKSKPMYLMIGVCAPREQVQIYYIGSAVGQGGFSLVPPEVVPGQVVVYTNGPPPQQQEQQQQPPQPQYAQQQQQEPTAPPGQAVY